MRLLSRPTNGEFKLTTFTDDESLPPYAILSHTWIDGQEIIYDELIAGTGREKAGYNKLRFCGGRATQDGLHYFWVDTCCINKATSDELGTAINSMFRWYQRASKCYVFLSDVPDPQLNRITWEDAFRRSQWFTRGWTLQELVAPPIVEFFSKEGERLGCKVSLMQEVHKITRIPISVLKGQQLSELSVDERMSWAAHRITTIPEDKAYCLFGIFGVFMPLIYGEGEEHASTRLKKKIQKRLGQSIAPRMEDAHGLKATQNDILKTLSVAASAPYNAYQSQHDPICLSDTRVALLQDIYNWADGVDSPCIFWLSGLAGTGKSTVARTVATEHARQGRLLGSFFFSRGGGDVGHARKFVTSLAVQLADNIPSLRQAVCEAISKRSDVTSQSLRDQWHHLVLRPLSKLAGSGNPSSYTLVIDALDECEGENDTRAILQLFARAQSLETGRLLIFLTSRPEVPIRNGFIHVPSAVHQDFVLHDISPIIVDHDIRVFLQHNFQALSKELNLIGWPGAEIIDHLVHNAGSLFIWAATAYRFVREGRRFAVKRLNILLQPCSKALNTPEKHLDEIYLTVLRNCISVGYSDEEADELRRTLTSLLGSIVTLLSPLPVISLSKLLLIPQSEINETLNELHAILAIPDEPSRPLRLHHPSFRDFLLDSMRCGDTAFWVEEKQAHRTLAIKCMQLMSQHLKQDVCGLKQPGALVVDMAPTVIARCLPPEIQYACLYWVQHLERGETSLRDNGEVHLFLQDHLLHWLEALGWMCKVPEGVHAISSLNLLISSTGSPNISNWLHDTKRFVLYNRPVIEQAPLQTYYSALVFAPTTSKIREQFRDCIPHWISQLPKVESNWTALLQTLEGHSDCVRDVAFSPDGALLASASDDTTVKLWDTRSGAALQTLKGHLRGLRAVAFSPNSTQLASASYDKTIKLWDVWSGTVLYTLRGHSETIDSIAFSPDGLQLASASQDNTVKLWEIRSGSALQTLEGHSNHVRSVAFSPDGTMLASASGDSTVQLWDAQSGAALQRLEGHSNSVSSVAFSPDGTILASASWDRTVKLWDVRFSTLLYTLKDHSDFVRAVVFSPQRAQLASASDDGTVKLWDTQSGALLQTHKGYSASFWAIAFSPDGTLLASASCDNTVKLWDTQSRAALQIAKGHSGSVRAIAFSPDGTLLASSSRDQTVRLWDARSGELLHTLEGQLHNKIITVPDLMMLAFSPDGALLALTSDDKTVKLWDARTGAALQTLKGHSGFVRAIAFSLDGTLLASSSRGQNVRLWDARSGELLRTLEGYSNNEIFIVPKPMMLAFSPDGTLLALASDDDTIKLWDAQTGAELQTLKGNWDHCNPIAFSPDGTLLSIASGGDTVGLWDVRSGAAPQTIQAVVPTPSPSDNGACLEINQGRLHSPIFSASMAVPYPASAPSILVKKRWISVDGTKVLLLPSEYAPPKEIPNSVAVHGRMIGVGCPSGRLFVMAFNSQDLS